MSVVVVGGANIDIRARVSGPAAMGTSNPGQASFSPGGVARNIAENLGRLGADVHLVTALGDDAFAASLREATERAGVVVHTAARGSCGTYLAVLDHEGELLLGVADMRAVESLTPADLAPFQGLIAGAEVVVTGANLMPDCMAWILDAAAGTRVVLDGVSAPKARRISTVLNPARPIEVLSLTTDELSALTHVVGDEAAIIAAAETLLAQGVRHVWVHRGPLPSLLVHPGGVERIAPPRVDLVDVTGGGDAMLAGLVFALLRGDPMADAARFGQAAGALTVTTAHTVHPDLSAALVERTSHADH